MEEIGVDSFVKYPIFDREQKRSGRKQVHRVESWPYDAELDQFTRPQGKPLAYRSGSRVRTANDYLSRQRANDCADGSGCPVKEQCTRAGGNRRVYVSMPLMAYRERARRNLLSEEGRRLHFRRGVEVDSVFGRLKHNWASADSCSGG